MLKFLKTGQIMNFSYLTLSCHQFVWLKYLFDVILQNWKIKIKPPVNKNTLFPKIINNYYRKMKENQIKQHKYSK